MSCVPDSEHRQLQIDILVHTTRHPWISVAIWENYIRIRLKIVFNIITTKFSHCPFIVGSKAILVNTNFCVKGFIESIRKEHWVGTSWIWHSKLIALEYIPPIVIKIAWSICVIKVHAGRLPVIIVVDTDWLVHSSEDVLHSCWEPTCFNIISKLFLHLGWVGHVLESLTRSIYWVCWHRFQKVSWIRVICHGHIHICSADMVI